MTGRRAGFAALLGLAFATWSGCGPGEPASWEGVPPLAGGPQPGRFADAEPVIGRAGPGGRPFEVTGRRPGAESAVHGTIGTRTFELSLRSRPLTQYPCTSCHAGPLVTTPRPEDAHQDIQPVHPAEAGGACDVCHTREDVFRLAVQGGGTATLDETYRLCAQCHYAQVDAWAGGAHGKRVAGWQGPRVVMGCADCHDPHAPTLEKRIPFRGPILP